MSISVFGGTRLVARLLGTLRRAPPCATTAKSPDLHRASLLVVVTACCLGVAVNASAADIKSISRLAAGPENVLFIADWKMARVHAITLPESAKKPTGPAFNILDLETLLSRELKNAKVTIEDMVVRPGTAEVYVAVSFGAERTPALFVVTADSKARRVDLNASKSTSIELRDAPTSNFKFWNETPERSFTVTDMKWRDGELYVAGLSNQDFASTLRRVKFPFDAQQSVTSVEIYHTGHNLIETRAPIRAMSFATLGGNPYLVAVYTCTPLVLIPVDELKDGAHVRGKTIAELGYGNTPADLIAFTKTDQGKTEDFLLLVNFERGSSIIPVSQLEAAAARPGIETVVPFGQIVGLDVTPIPLVGTTRIDNLDEQTFIVVRRRLETDALQLVSIQKELSFRLSDFVSEYAFPQYSFKGNDFQLKYIKPRQDMLLRQEGFADQIKPSE